MQYKTVAPRAIVNNIHIMVLYLPKKKKKSLHSLKHEFVFIRNKYY